MDVLGKVADMDGPKFNFMRTRSKVEIQRIAQCIAQ